ncbi:MAG: hypothetical protein QOH93_2022 [Chloroflexia bacterium]|nr:hypothetical protein [Chloroflexia bacterium]
MMPERRITRRELLGLAGLGAAGLGAAALGINRIVPQNAKGTTCSR